MHVQPVWRLVHRFQVTEDKTVHSEGNDQWPHLYAVHNLATAAVASSLCMHLFQTGVRVFPPPRKRNVAPVCADPALHLNAAPQGKREVFGRPLVVVW